MINPMIASVFRPTGTLTPVDSSTEALTSTVMALPKDLVEGLTVSNLVYESRANLLDKLVPYTAGISGNNFRIVSETSIGDPVTVDVPIPQGTIIGNINVLRLAVSNHGDVVVVYREGLHIRMTGYSFRQIPDPLDDQNGSLIPDPILKFRRYQGRILTTAECPIEQLGLFSVVGEDPQPIFVTGKLGGLSDFRLYYIRRNESQQKVLVYYRPLREKLPSRLSDETLMLVSTL